MSSQDYTAWMGQEMKKLIDLITNRSFQNDPESLNKQIAEIQRGLEYALNNPGAVDELVMKVTSSLKALKSDHPAAKAAKIKGWKDPLDYTVVENLQKELQIGAYAQ